MTDKLLHAATKSPEPDDFFTSSPESRINRTRSAWSVVTGHVSEPEFSRSGLFDRVGYSQPCSLNRLPASHQVPDDLRIASPSVVTSSHRDDRRYRYLRTLASSPYRAPFHTSTVSLPDIKEATNEENESSSNSSTDRDKITNFRDRGNRTTSQQVDCICTVAKARSGGGGNAGRSRTVSHSPFLGCIPFLR